MQENWPQIIKDVGFDFSWDEKKVWALNEPVTEMNIEDLEWHFKIPFFWENGIYNLTPEDVIRRPEDHPKEFERTMTADLKHPIDIMENKGKWLILDGLHRLMKAKIQGIQKVKVREIPRTRIKDICV